MKQHWLRGHVFSQNLVYTEDGWLSNDMNLVLKCLKCLRCGHFKRKSREYCEVLSAPVNWELYSAWVWSPGCANHNWTVNSQYGTILMSCCFNFCFAVLCIVLHNGVSENNTMAYFSEFLQRNWKRRDVYKVRVSHSGGTLCVIITVRWIEGRHCHIGWHPLCVQRSHPVCAVITVICIWGMCVLCWLAPSVCVAVTMRCV